MKWEEALLKPIMQGRGDGGGGSFWSCAQSMAPAVKVDCWWMKCETYRSFYERCRTFEAYEPLALALAILAHQLDEDIVESGGGDHGASGHGHMVVNHFFF